MFSMRTEALLSNLEQAMTLGCRKEFMEGVQRRVAASGGHPDTPGTMFRASSIGKPWVLQVLDRWYGGSRQYTVAQCVTMLNGIVSQELIAELLNLMEYQFKQEVTLKYKGVTGHADIVVRADNEIIVLECKSMGSHIISGFANNPNDDYGYLSQLSFYWWRLKETYPHLKVSAAFVLYNRNDSKVRCVPIIEQAMIRKVERLQSAVDIIANIEPYDVDTLLELDMIPPCIDGKIPSSMMRSRWARVLYAGREHSEGVTYHVQDRDAIAKVLKALPQQRADGEELNEWNV